jgi:hypothetical protein
LHALRLLRTAPVSCWFNATPKICKTTYGNVILARSIKLAL